MTDRTPLRQAEVNVITAATEAVDSKFAWFECERLRAAINQLERLTLERATLSTAPDEIVQA